LRVTRPGPLEPWDDPPRRRGFKGGDLYGVIEHLDRLQQLGINALYLNPVFTSASTHRYHTDDYFHVDPMLGGDAALRELLDEAHRREMHVVLDGVFNHCGRGFWPFHHVLENGADSPYRSWFYLDADVLTSDRGLVAYPSGDENEAMARLRGEGTPPGEASRNVLGYEAWWDLPALPRLNLDEPRLREMMLDVAEHWLRFGIDGWRLDVAEEVGEEFWRELRERVRGVDPDAYLVAEVWHTKPEWLRGDLFDAFMNYPLMDAILGFVAGRRIDRRVLEGVSPDLQVQERDAQSFATRALELDGLYDASVSAVQLNLIGSHDTPRVLTICSGDMDSVRLAMLVQMTLPGAPCVYYGDEIGMEGEMDPDCRASFPSDPTRWADEPHDWLVDLMALRHSDRALRDGDLAIMRAEGMAVAYRRTSAYGDYVVIVNAGEDGLDWELSLETDVADAELVRLRGGPDEELHASLEPVGGGGSSLRLEVPGRTGGVVSLRAPV
jgi:neopullulanase